MAPSEALRFMRPVQESGTAWLCASPTLPHAATSESGVAESRQIQVEPVDVPGPQIS
jgi:hypothetical protein